MGRKCEHGDEAETCTTCIEEYKKGIEELMSSTKGRWFNLAKEDKVRRQGFRFGRTMSRQVSVDAGEVS